MHYITAYYKFLPITNVEATKIFFTDIAKKTGTKGLIILASEGFNSTVSNKSFDELQKYKSAVLSHFDLSSLNFKDSESEVAPFKWLSIKTRTEIVTTGNNDLAINHSKNNHLSPEEWNKFVEHENPLIIDTRNWYEYKIGTFEGALNPNTEKFTDFPKYMDSLKIEKKQKILIFCTGGIRCEKGILELQDKGYSEVYQLDGGILNYIKEKPNELFKGECFVFDQRVSVDQKLEPSRQYKLCPHCGQPGKTDIICKKCDSAEVICDGCYQLKWKQDTCSKNCANHYELNPFKKARQQKRPVQNSDH